MSVHVLGGGAGGMVGLEGVPLLHKLVTSVTCLRAWQSDFGVTDAGGGVCSAWVDQKNGASASQGTAGKRPTIVANASGPHPAIRFDGADDFLTDTVLDVPSPGTTNTFVWFVCVQNSWVAGGGLFSFAQATGQMRVGAVTATPQLMQNNTINGPGNGGATLGTLIRGEVFWSNTTSDYLKLGATTTTGTNVGNGNPAAGFLIGADTTTGGSVQCDFYAILVFSGKPSAAELAALSAAAAGLYPGVAT